MAPGRRLTAQRVTLQRVTVIVTTGCWPAVWHRRRQGRQSLVGGQARLHVVHRKLALQRRGAEATRVAGRELSRLCIIFKGKTHPKKLKVCYVCYLSSSRC